jgi:hypothetical protein
MKAVSAFIFGTQVIPGLVARRDAAGVDRHLQRDDFAAFVSKYG